MKYLYSAFHCISISNISSLQQIFQLSIRFKLKMTQFKSCEIWLKLSIVWNSIYAESMFSIQGTSISNMWRRLRKWDQLRKTWWHYISAVFTHVSLFFSLIFTHRERKCFLYTSMGDKKCRLWSDVAQNERRLI